MILAAESRDNFVDIDVELWHWLVLGGVVLSMLAIDLYRHREAHEPSAREAGAESAFWVLCGLSFGAFVAIVFGGEAFGEYISGYLIEKSLSVDNVFVWAILFTAMAIPLKYQHRVLFWGIFGALGLRALFIFLGSALIQQFTWVLAIFGAFLVYTGAKIIRHRDDEGEEAKTTGLGVLKRIMPVSEEFDGQKFVTKIDGRKAATPLLAALVVVEATDVIFAVDSVPAILAVSNEPYLVLASNAFAILGLRAMYFLLANARARFHYLSHALGGILIFVGVKMTLTEWYHLNTYVSLAIIIVMLIAAIIFSERKARELGVTGPELTTLGDHS
jgi:tellurite resistance protein TerC